LCHVFRLIERRGEANLKNRRCELRALSRLWELTMRIGPVLLLAQLVKRFSRQSEGSTLMTFALALIPIMTGLGAALDFSRANDARASLQQALDAAVLAGAHDDTASWADVAQSVFNGTFQAKSSSVGSPTFTLNSDGTFSGSSSGSVPTSVLGVMGVKQIPISANSVVMLAPTSPNEQYCMLALNLTAQAAVDVTGNGQITIKAPNCVMQVNSKASNATNLTGNATVNTTDNCVVGGAKVTGNSSITPPPLSVCHTVPDPFANWPTPTITKCDYTNYKLSGNVTVTLNPGVYCGGMTFSGPVNVTFAAGSPRAAARSPAMVSRFS
jgi:hypothetical protein